MRGDRKIACIKLLSSAEQNSCIQRNFVINIAKKSENSLSKESVFFLKITSTRSGKINNPITVPTNVPIIISCTRLYVTLLGSYGDNIATSNNAAISNGKHNMVGSSS